MDIRTHPATRAIANGAHAGDPTPLDRQIEIEKVGKPLRIAVVTPIPTPYRDPFWNELARRPGVQLTVYYCAAGKSDRPWKDGWQRRFPFEVLSGWNLLRWRGSDASCFWNPGLGSRLAVGQFDVLLIGGYNHLTMWSALWFAIRSRTPYVLMCESHLKSYRPGWKQALKGPILRWIVRHAAGFLPTGRLAADFLRSYGADERLMTALPNVPDVAALAARTQQWRMTAEFPGPTGLADRPLVLFVGRLIPKKRAELVIRAFHAIHAENDAALVIVGDGPLRPALEQLVAELAIGDRVHFAGFVQPDDVLRWYAAARVFVLPSSETWGVVVIEALATGLSVIVSDEVGCHADVVIDPALGSVVKAGSLESLTVALRRHLGQRDHSAEFRAAWQELGSNLSYDRLAQRVDHDLRSCVNRHRKDSATAQSPHEAFP